MPTLKFYIGACVLGSLLYAPLVFAELANDYKPHSVGAAAPEVHINGDRTMTIKSARVDHQAGTTFYLQMKWNQLPLRFTMKTSAQTKVVKKHGGVSTASAIKIGDYLDVEGDLIVGSDFFGLDAKQIKDWSMQEESETYAGKIVEITPTGFTLETALGKRVAVVPGNGLSIKKGAVVIPWGRLAKGDSVVIAEGVYDYSKNTLTLKDLVIFQATNSFAARNYEGKLKGIESISVPTTLIVTVGALDYKVKLSEQTNIQKKNRSKAALSRFVIGDTIRFYGPLRESEKTLQDEHVVDAEIVRNFDL